jgi:hypothetical protein
MQPNQRATVLLITLTSLLLAPACNNDEKNPDSNVLSVSAQSYGSEAAQAFATIEMPGFSKSLSQSELGRWARFAVRAKSGTIRVRFVQVKGVADTVGRAEVSLDIVKGYTYYVNLSRELQGSPNLCIGCTGFLTFPIIGSESASTDRWRLNYIHGWPLCVGCVTWRTKPEGTVATRN